MITKIQFQKDARVLTADGQQIGLLERVVVNPETMVITDIVVRTGTLINHEERVVPLGFVAETGEELIVLREEAGEFETLPPFEERHIVDRKGETDQPANNAVPVMMCGSPQFSAPTPLVPAEQFVTQIEQNIPEGTVALKEGAKVITAEGRHVGNVERVLADPSEEQMTHLLISRGLLVKERKLIPMKWITTLDEDKVHLSVKKAFVENLAATPLAG